MHFINDKGQTPESVKRRVARLPKHSRPSFQDQEFKTKHSRPKTSLENLTISALERGFPRAHQIPRQKDHTTHFMFMIHDEVSGVQPGDVDLLRLKLTQSYENLSLVGLLIDFMNRLFVCSTATYPRTVQYQHSEASALFPRRYICTESFLSLLSHESKTHYSIR